MAADHSDDDTLTDGNGVFSNGADEATTPAITVADANENNAVPQAVDNVMYSDVCAESILESFLI